jgi:hypothetical protein
MSNHDRVAADELRTFFESYAAAWRANDVASIAEHWDSGRFAYYKAEEIAQFYLDWGDVLQYWRHNQQFHSRVEMRFGPFPVKPLPGNWILAPVPMRWDILFSPDAVQMNGLPFAHRGAAMGGDNQVLCLLAKSDAGWRLCGWSETPDSPISYIARLYKANASMEILRG